MSDDLLARLRAQEHVLVCAEAADKIEVLREALRPFADYAPRGLASVPGDLVITNGSQLSKRQLTMADCYRAREAVKP